MQIDLTQLPDQDEEETPKQKPGVDLVTLPDTNANKLREMYRTGPVAPEQEAQVYDISNKTGLPEQTVRNNLDKAKKIANEPDWDTLEKDHPTLAQKLASDEHLFRVAADSTPELAFLENVLASLTTGTIGVIESLARTPEAAVRYLGIDKLPTTDIGKGRPLETPADLMEFFAAAPFTAITKGSDAATFLPDKLAERAALANEILAQDTQTFGRIFKQSAEKGELGEQAFADARKGDFSTLGDLASDPVAWGGFIAQALPSLLFAAATRGNLLAIGALEGGAVASDIAAFEELTGEKISQEDYIRATLQAATISPLLEKIGLGSITRKVGKGIFPSVLKVLTATTTEGVTEAAQELNSNLAQKLTFNPDKNIFEGIIAAAMGGMGAGGGTSTTAEVGNAVAATFDASRNPNIIQDTIRAAEAEENQKRAEEVLRTIRESDLREQSPEEYADLVDSLAKDKGVEEIYFDAQDLKDFYAQQGKTVHEALVGLPEFEDELERVLEAGGGDIIIPLQQIAKHLVDRPEDAGLSNIMRFSPDQMSKLEAESFKQEKQEQQMAEEADRVIKGKTEDELFLQSVKAVEDSVYSQLESANRFTSDVNRTYATFASNFYTVMADRLGVSPKEMFDLYPINVRSVMGNGPAISFEQLEESAFEVDRSSDSFEFVIRGTDNGQDIGRMGLSIRDDNKMQIHNVEVNLDRRGERIGQQLIEQAYKLAKAEGVELVSDSAVSAFQLRAYEALKRRGWTIQYSDPERVAEILELADRAEKAGKTIAALGVGTLGHENGPHVVNKIEAPVQLGTVARPFDAYEPAQEAARKYAERSGIPATGQLDFQPLNPERQTRVANEYDVMEHNPRDPETAAAYQAMEEESIEQYKVILETGLEIEFMPEGKDPYKTPHDAVRDVHENNHLYIFSTREGFGSNAEFDPVENPLLKETEFEMSGQTMLVNDVFRVVHDYFGHIKDGNGFRAQGEDNAWQSHAQMYSPLARRAMTTETRGQNSWVNYGPYAEQNRGASGADTIYADQKIGLLPIWVSEEGRVNGKQRQPSTGDGRVQPTVRSDGRIELTHFAGKSGITRVDPGFQGKGTRGKEKRRTSRIPRSYYGIDPGSENGYRVETQFRGRPRLTTSIAAELLYDYEADPENLRLEVDEAEYDHIHESERNVRDAGYSGYWLNHPQLGLVAVSFDVLPVESSDDSYFQTESKPLERAQKNNIGLFSAVEQAVIDMKLPEWKVSKKAPTYTFRLHPRDSSVEPISQRFNSREDAEKYATEKGLTLTGSNLENDAGSDAEYLIASKVIPLPPRAASGKAIWQKLVKMPGIKKEELETLNLEAFLNAGGKFTRDDVRVFVQNNGVEIEEVIADTEASDFDEDSIEWQEDVLRESKEWQHRVEDYLYEYESVDFLTGQSGEFYFWDFSKWIEDGSNFQLILDDLDIKDNRIPGQEDLTAVRNNDHFGEAGDWESFLLVAKEYETELEIDVEETIREVMKADFEEAAEEAAETEYMDDPVRSWYNRDADIEIRGSDERGYIIYHDGQWANTGEMWSFAEAEIQAIQIARENGDLEHSPQAVRWGEYIYDAYPADVNYRERKLTMPDLPGPAFFEEAHFDDPNIIAFSRVTDRELVVNPKMPVDDLVKKAWDANKIGPNNIRVATMTDEQIEKVKEKGRESLTYGDLTKEQIKEIGIQLPNEVLTRLLDEFQSDLHQQARERGYKDPNVDIQELAEKHNRLDTIITNDLIALYTKLSEMSQFDLKRKHGIIFVKRKHGIIFESNAIVVPFKRSPDHAIDGQSLGKRSFQAIAFQILSETEQAKEILSDALEETSGYKSGASTEASYVYIDKILRKELGEREFNVLQSLAKDHRETGKQIEQQRRGVIDAPFKGNAWVELGVRRELIDAVESGMEAFAWADSQMIVNRYNETYRKMGETHYDRRITSIVKKITKQKPKHLNWDGSERVEPRIEINQITAEDRTEMLNSGRHPNTVPAEGLYYWTLFHPEGREVISKTATGMQFQSEDEAFASAKKHIKYEQGVGYWIVPITDELRERITAEGLPLFQDKTKGAFTPSSSTITLLQDADLSTFLHEFGHFQLEVMADLASRHDTPKEIRQDMQNLLDWFGVENINAWNRMSLEDKRKHHEKFARGFEKYLFTGKAPNSKLADIFARIREWMLRIYKNLKNFNVTLTPEVTAVFDKLVATEDQILESEELQGYRQLFKSEEDSGMTPAKWRDYQAEADKPTKDAVKDLQNRALRDMKWLRRARAKELRLIQRQAKEKRAEVRSEVEAEVMAEPIYQAMTFLKTGEVGDEVKVEKGHRLANAALEEMYPKTALGNPDWRALPQGKYGLRGKDGMHPDMVAPIFGFKSGDELVGALLEAENVKEKIEGITDQRMLERYGELSTPEAMEAAADRAIHNEARTKLIATELVALEKSVGKKASLLRAAKMYARETLANMEVRNLRKTGRFAATERRAAKERELALRKGDRELAAKHTRSQLIANLIYSGALKANDEVAKMLRLFKKFDNPGTRKNLDQGYLDQIDQLLERYDLRAGVSQKEIDRRTSLNAWVEQQRADGIDPAVDERLLNEATRTHFSRLTLAEMRGLYDAVRSIEHIGRLKKKLLTAKDEREFKERMDQVIASISDKATKVVKEHMESNAPMDNLRDGKNEWFAMHRKLGSVVRVMDGLKDGGPVWELFLRPANERADYETVEHEKATIELDRILKPVYSQGRMNKMLDIPGLPTPITKEGRFLMLLNMGNKVNYDRLVAGELGNGWTEEHFEIVRDSATKEEWDAAQGVWDFINTYWEAIAAKQKRITGVAPEKVEANEVETPHGTYRGGYFPIAYNPKRSQKSDANTQNELLVQKLQGNYTAATTRRGHTKERGKSGTGPLRYDMGVITNHVNQVIHDLAWHEWALDANRIVRNAEFEAVVRKHYGDPIVSLLKHAVEDIVVGDVPAKNRFERAVNHIRIGSTIVGLGYSVFTTALQPLGLAQSMVRIGPKHVAKGIGRWLGSAKGMEDSVAWVYENSDFMRLRNKTMMREMDEVLNQVRGEKLTEVKASFFLWIAKAQMIADMPTWIGQYHKSMENHSDHAKAVQEANQAVKDSQGSGLGMDRSEIQRGGPLLKIFTNFYSYFNATFNLLADSYSQMRTPHGRAKYTADFMMLTILPATMAAILREAIYGLSGGGDDEEKDAFDIAMWLARENLSYMTGLMVGVRELSSAMQGYYGYSGPAGLRFFNEFGKFLQQAGQGEVDKALLKSANQVGGIVFHYPAAQVERTAEGVMELAEGDTNNPLVLLTGTEGNK